MNIQEKIEESKKRTQLMNSIIIDWQYAQQIIPTVLPIISREESNNGLIQVECEMLYNLFTNIENNIKELKNMIPFSKGGMRCETTSVEILN
jgi:predicted  nucleic acid-binding Zn ribbon protein